ncbi:MAG: sigma-54-dependent Fis family transcriptional regulator [Desulfobacterales bacterium]|nr:MAG: sigma-54-dependent Fis family transcriptional regulator [Desulfobacterales bacterium]
MLVPFVGISESIERIKELVAHVSDTGLNVVITGESGVGKEVVAQNLYHSSGRKDKPFVKVNCAALPEGLLESELFGFEKGAFTGADRKKRGKFELANEGVLFLDEIGDMSLNLQSKLLHVLQSGEFAPLGSEREMKTDAWVLAATNQELNEKVKNGLFREDLYYRLNIIKIYIPPLRKRPEDIPLLIDYFLEKYASQFGDKRLIKPDHAIMDRLISYQWPGNVRELQNILKSCLVVGNWEEVINELSFKSEMVSNSGFVATGTNEASIIDDLLNFQGENSPNHAAFSLKKIKRKALDRIEKEIISHVLDQTGWNRTKATKILKISYKTLLYKISDLNIKPPPDTSGKISS